MHGRAHPRSHWPGRAAHSTTAALRRQPGAEHRYVDAPVHPKRGQPKRLVHLRAVGHASAERAAEGSNLLLVKCRCRLDNCLDRKCEVAGVAMKPLLDLIR